MLLQHNYKILKPNQEIKQKIYNLRTKHNYSSLKKKQAHQKNNFIGYCYHGQ
jgi:hypothetical protein